MKSFKGILIAPLLFVAYSLQAADTLCILDANTRLPIPFSQIQLDTALLTTGIDGCIVLEQELLNSKFSAIGYKTDTNSNSENGILLKPYWEYVINDTIAKNLLQGTFARIHDDPESDQPFSYSTYNKLIVSSTDVRSTRNKLLKYLPKLPKSYRDTAADHHLMLSESITHRFYLDQLHDKEMVVQSKLTGTDNANLLTVNSQLNSLSLYKPFIQLSAKDYTNPLYVLDFNRYLYRITDTSFYAPTKRKVIIVAFHPKPNAHFEGLKGSYLIDLETKGIIAAIFYPANNNQNQVSYGIENTLKSERWFPKNTTMVLSFDAVDPGQSVFMKTQTSIKNIQFTSTIAKKKFTDVSIYYDKDSTKHYRGTPYWNTQRAAPLDQKDKNTYSFFEHFVSINQFGRFLRIGENLYFKEISLNKVNIRLKDILKFNAHESFRVGIGAYTTHQLSSTFSAGFSYGYGTKDQTHKYQLWGNTLLHHPTQTQIQFRYQKDLLESGRPKFHGDRPMYGTEWLRRLKVARMDQYQGPSFSFSSHPVKYLDVKTQISKYEVRPQYHYIYNGAFSSFELNQFALSARYSFGQMYFRMEDKKIPFESKYPVLSFTYQQGFSLNQQGTEYKSINLKGEYELKSASFGSSLFQVSLGAVSKTAPYFLMFNGKGAKGVLTVAHNSFETMRPYEFASTSYVNLFYTHNFGSVNVLSFRGFKPKAHVAFNAGWGWDQSTASHEGVTPTGYAKGYYEIGGLIKNLLQIQVSAVKVGFGIGAYHRIGFYAHSFPLDNTRIKIATTFTL